jgi:hypothetical protein
MVVVLLKKRPNQEWIILPPHPIPESCEHRAIRPVDLGVYSINLLNGGVQKTLPRCLKMAPTESDLGFVLRAV